LWSAIAALTATRCSPPPSSQESIRPKITIQVTDNLLDFSHLSYVHARTLGGTERIAAIRPKVVPIAEGVRVSREVPDVPPPEYYRPLWPYAGSIDRWLTYDFTLPATLTMGWGARPADAAAAHGRGPGAFPAPRRAAARGGGWCACGGHGSAWPVTSKVPPLPPRNPAWSRMPVHADGGRSPGRRHTAGVPK
jgi:hypothetical protein